MIYGVGGCDAGGERLRVLHGAAVAVAVFLFCGPVDGLRAIVGLGTHIHLARAAKHKGVAVDEARVAIDDRPPFVEEVVPTIYVP